MGRISVAQELGTEEKEDEDEDVAEVRMTRRMSKKMGRRKRGRKRSMRRRRRRQGGIGGDGRRVKDDEGKRRKSCVRKNKR